MVGLLSFIVTLFLLVGASNGRYITFKRNFGTLDAMDNFNPSYPAFRPIQQSPIYGIECLENGCYNQRFRTVRFQNLVIVKYTNHWTPLVTGNANRWSVTCPNNMLSLGMWCHEFSCNKIRMVCGTIGSGFKLHRTKTTVNPPSTPSSVSCPDGMYMQGLECQGNSCDRRGLLCVGLQLTRQVGRQNVLLRTDSRHHESYYFSEEWNGYSEKMDGPIFAMTCVGPHYCDNKLLYAVQRGTQPMLGPIQKWLGPVGKPGTTKSCPNGMVVSQMRCMKAMCQELHIGCSKPANSKVRVGDQDRLTSNVFSAHWPFQDKGFCPEGYYVREIFCLEDFCAHIVLGCVKVYYIE